MDIDIKNAEMEFIRYTERYNLKNENILRKQQHSLRVMKNCKQIARDLKCNEEQIKIAELIGLLHDIARFKQYTEYKHFNDLKSFDHGNFGAEILEIDLRKYIIDERFDELIKIAIKNHNKYQIEDGLTEEQKLFCKIIRDADKTDILYEATGIFWNGKEKEIEKLTISKEILEYITNEETYKRNINKELNLLENVIAVITMIYDINYKISFEIIAERNYISKILNRFDIKGNETKKYIQEIEKKTNAFIKKKIS